MNHTSTEVATTQPNENAVTANAVAAVAQSELRRQKTADAASPSLFRDFLDLTKPEISFQVSIASLAGYLMGTTTGIDGWILFHTMMGVAVAAGGAGALNHVMENRYDKLMKRTLQRPLPSGRIIPFVAATFGTILIFGGIAWLYLFVNHLTATLASLTVSSYLMVYTPLKRITKYNTIFGTIPGALPTLGGWAAATGTIEPNAWVLFGILAVWQMPHFMSLAWMYKDDYARGGFKMLPVVEPDGVSTGRQTVGFTVLLIILSLLPTIMGFAGWLYFAGALIMGLMFLRPAITFAKDRTGPKAKKVLMASIMYIPAYVLLIIIDYIIF